MAEDVSLVKINSELYKEVSDFVDIRSIEYPSIKNFVEVSVRNQLNRIKYDIQNRDEILSPAGKLIVTPKGGFVSCLACGKMFLNDKEKTKQGKRICPKCTEVIKKLSNLVD